MENTSQSKRTIMAVLAVVVGIFMVAAAPFLIQISIEKVVAALIKISIEKPAYSSGILIFSILFPIYRGLIFMGGITLILISRSIYKGKEWTFPVGLLASAFPSAGGMFMMMPYVSFIDGFPIPAGIAMVGLLFFWSFILLRNVDKWLKWGQFLVLTFSGMLTTHALITGTGNLRMLLTRPEKPLFDGLGTWVLAWSAPIQWICAVLLFIAIFHIAARKYSGWWLALIAVTTLAAIDIPMQIIRLTMTSSTALDYSYGLPMIIGLLFTLLFPKFKTVLQNEHGTENN
ncbi:MAG: hypothetical protein GYA34_13955 [Chloroflexi bacterium]|jgi:hypothetical protein|nr:hypothetical protein [Chloroflexota bacterium]